MITYFYLDELRTVKYWENVAFNIIARMILNAYPLYLENSHGEKISRLQFYPSLKAQVHEASLQAFSQAA